MSTIELSPPAARAGGAERSLCGWGRTAFSRARVHTPDDPDRVAELIGEGRCGGGVIARGAGRSYGDAAQNGGGVVLDMTACDKVLWIDREQRLARAQAGATIAQLMARLSAHGLSLPVVPGTRHVTLAGAIASDIHGKNHHRDGGFARHVRSLALYTPAAGVVEVSERDDADLFYATLGGMGLTGVVLEATLGVEELACPWVAADSDRTDGLAGTLQLLGEPERHRYSVAWLDMLAPGTRMGRAVVSRAEPLPASAAPQRARARGARPYPGALSAPARWEVPRGWPAAALRRETVRAFNELRWRSSPRHELERPQPLDSFFFPLDVVGCWNRLYGPAGLIQYQLAIPDGHEQALEECFAVMSARRLPVYLAVLKRFGPEFGGPLSFPLRGWTLAADIPAAAPGVGETLDRLDEVVAGAGGRIYLSKDSRLRPELLGVMYPRLGRFREICEGADPDGLMRSDLARRVGIREGAR